MPRLNKSEAGQGGSPQEALRRCERLHQLSHVIASDLDIERIVQAVTDIATQECGAQFGAFFYNVIDPRGERYQLFTLSGAPRSAFEHFGLPRNTEVFEHTFRGRGVVRADDIRTDPRYGKNEPHKGMPAGHLPVVSYLAVPVISRRREVIGGLFFGHEQAGVFTAECEAFVLGIAGHAAVAIDNARLHQAAQIEIERRKAAEAQLELLLREVKHRYKNAITTIQAIAMQSFAKADAEPHRVFNARLSALGKALDLLTTRDWDRAAVADIIRRALAPFAYEERFDADGDDASIRADNSLALALALHELATNAVKYGALSTSDGRVQLRWRALEGEPQKIAIHWSESGGPPVALPERSGFGTTLIERALSGPQQRPHIVFAPSGVVCDFEIPL